MMPEKQPQQPLRNSFRHAFAGMSFVLRTQRNAKIHLAITLLVILIAIWLELPSIEWALLVLAIALVWVTESLNTALEATLDAFKIEYHPFIKIAKDVGAAAVLLAAIAAVIIGILIMGPPLLYKLFGIAL
jgi:diacylglycerol kinase